MHNQYWVEQENKFLIAIKNVTIPNSNLDEVDYLEVNSQKDLNNIPTGGGCYWIWTNEPVTHMLHKNKLPDKINSGQIIYNGIAKDDVKGRVFHHLFGLEDAGWSGISMDVYKKTSQSHRKKAMSPIGKVPYIFENKIAKRGSKKKNFKKGDTIKVLSAIKSKDQLLKINLSSEEREFICNTKYPKYFFRNGINITENKHKNYSFRVYFITGLSSLYLEFIEKKWRENGLPRLCSYTTGR